MTSDQQTQGQSSTKGKKTSQGSLKKVTKQRKALNRTLALETFALMKELTKVLKEEELVLVQMADLIDRTPVRSVNDDFMNRLTHGLRERRGLLESHHRRTAQMSGILQQRLEKEGVLRTKAATTAPKGPVKRVAGGPIMAGAGPLPTGPAATAPVASPSALPALSALPGPAAPGPPACSVCQRELVKGDHFARCNRQNLVFHGICIEPLFDCPKCGDNLASFMAYF